MKTEQKNYTVEAKYTIDGKSFNCIIEKYIKDFLKTSNRYWNFKNHALKYK